jgi:uncharacterized protein YbaR (Trm112 family)
MKRSLIGILVCPSCSGELRLTVEEEDDSEVVKGSIYCIRCHEHYPIENSIPNLLPPSLR